MPRVLLSVRISLIATTGLCLAGCSSSDRHDRFRNDAITSRPVVAMRGEGAFFDGKIKAELTVSRGRATPFGDTEGGSAGSREAGGRRGGRGRWHHDEEEGGGDTDDSDSPVHPIRPAGSALAVTLRLKLQNLSPDAFDVQIHDVRSDLGDFAVRPERMLLAPGQSGELDPMVSELGVTSDEIPVTVVLRAAGKTESRDIVVKNLFTPASEK